MTTRSSIWGRDPCFSICFWTICDQTWICTRSESTLIQVIEAWPLIVKYKQKTVKSFLDSDIKIIKSMRPSFEKLNNPRFCSTLERVDLSEKANYNCQFKPLVDRFYSELKIKIISTKSYYIQKICFKVDEREQHWEQIWDNNARKVCTYKFMPDTFINSIILELKTEEKFDINYPYPLSIQQIQSTDSRVHLFRIKNFLMTKFKVI